MYSFQDQRRRRTQLSIEKIDSSGGVRGGDISGGDISGVDIIRAHTIGGDISGNECISGVYSKVH